MGLGLGLGFGAFGLIFLLPFIVVPIVIVVSAIRMSSFQRNVFRRIGDEQSTRITNMKKPNKHYIKTSCDHCGAKCIDSSDISPSGDLRCSYCNQWFNVLRA